jgi:hypothetical protein
VNGRAVVAVVTQCVCGRRIDDRVVYRYRYAVTSEGHIVGAVD